ncbi:hypothetical protein HZB88_05180 [archaeon]|nr:hypothetical protein [archaeon]
MIFKTAKGQASIELILLLVVILLLVQTIIIPSKDAAEKSANDASSIAIVRSQAQKLANAVELVDSSAVGAKQTIHLFIPKLSKIYCQGSTIIFQTWPELDIPEACKNEPGDSGPEANIRCTGSIELSLSSSMDCTPFSPGSLADRGPAYNTGAGAFVKLTVSKTLSEISFILE